MLLFGVCSMHVCVYDVVILHEYFVVCIWCKTDRGRKCAQLRLLICFLNSVLNCIIEVIFHSVLMQVIQYALNKLILI